VRTSDLICNTGSLLIQSVQAAVQVQYIHLQHDMAPPRTEDEGRRCIYSSKDTRDRISI
jgi:hypothetical protein